MNMTIEYTSLGCQYIEPFRSVKVDGVSYYVNDRSVTYETFECVRNFIRDFSPHHLNAIAVLEKRKQAGE